MTEVCGCFLDLNARLPDNPRLSRFPGSSVVERRTVNPLVGGSNPSRGASTINKLYQLHYSLLRYSAYATLLSLANSNPSRRWLVSAFGH